MAFKKSILLEGTGIYRPNRLAEVVVDVVGRWYTTDGDDVAFYLRESVTIALGRFLELFYRAFIPNAALFQTRQMMS